MSENPGQDVEFRTLGRFELVVGGEEVELGQAKQVALMAKLALFSRDHPRGALSKQELADAIRLEHRVTDVSAYVDPRLTLIRKLQRSDGTRLQLLRETKAGFRLEVRPEQFDSHTFVGHLAAARRMRRERDWVGAAVRLRLLIGMWRNRPMPELAAFEFIQREADELDAAYIDAQIFLAEIASIVGDHVSAIDALRILTRDRPTDERLAMALVEALRDAGQRLDALTEIERIEATLRVRGEPLDADLAAARVDLRRTPSERAVPPFSRQWLSDPASWPFVGRRDELAAVRGWIAEAVDGNCRTVVISGSSGIGKTRFIDEVHHSVGDRQIARIATAMHAGTVPYAPLIDATRQLIGAHPQLLRRVKPGDKAVLTRWLTVGGVPDHANVPEADAGWTPSPSNVTAAFGALLQCAAAVRPTIVVFDDLDHADASTHSLLAELTPTLDQHRVVLILLHGSAQPAALSWLAMHEALIAKPSTRRLDLRRLSPSEVRTLVGHLLGEPPADDRAQEFERVAAGDPLTTVIYARWLSGELPTQLLQPLRPSHSRAVLRAYTGAFAPGTMMALRTAAALGTPFNLRVLARAISQRVADVTVALEPARSVGLVAATGQADEWAFTNDSLRNILYTDMVDADRANAHRRAAEALEWVFRRDLNPHASSLAKHYRLSQPDVAALNDAAGFAIKAAKYDLWLLAFDSAAAHADAALADAVDPATQCEALIVGADARIRAGWADDARGRYDRAAQLAITYQLHRELATAALGFSGAHAFALGRDDVTARQIELMQHALTNDDLDDGIRAQLLARLAVSYFWLPPEQRAERAEQRLLTSAEAVRLARRGGDNRVLASVLRDRCLAAWSPDSLSERCLYAAEIVELADALGDHEILADGLLWRVVSCLEVGDHDGYAAARTRHRQIAETLQQPMYQFWVEALQGMHYVMTGDYAKGAEHAAAAQEVSASLEGRDADEIQNGIGALWLVAFNDQSTIDTLIDQLRQLVDQFPQVPAWRLGLAYAYSESGNIDATRVAFEQIAADHFALLPRDGTWLISLTWSCLIAERLNDVTRAQQLTDLLSPYAERNAVASYGFAYGGPVALGLAAAARLTNDLTGARRYLQIATVQCDMFDARPSALRVAHQHALLQLAAGDAAGALHTLTDTSEACRSIGMEGMRRRVDQLRNELEANL